MEKQVGRSIKRLQSDNGLEYLDSVFTVYYKDNGNFRHKTVRKTPQQNGLAERMNMTILERVKCMLFNAKLSKGFWGEVTNTTCYLINRSPSSDT